MRHRGATWLGLAVLGVGALAGCYRGTDGVGPSPPPPHHPLDLLGEDCLACHEHEAWDFVALHDRDAAGYDADCIKCHGTMMSEVTLDTQRPGPHAQMLPQFLAEGQVEPKNTDCAICHVTTDLLQKSAAGLGRQVAVVRCWSCHRAGGQHEPVLYPN